MDREGLNQRVLANQEPFRADAGQAVGLPIVGDVRGDGYFWRSSWSRQSQQADPGRAQRDRLDRPEVAVARTSPTIGRSDSLSSVARNGSWLASTAGSGPPGP